MSEWRPARLVVGLPMHADGGEHVIGRLARRFAQRLQGRFGIPVALVDERLTSLEAEGLLRAAGVFGLSAWCSRSATQTPPVWMPIKPVSGPTAGRICSISAVSSCSASGNGLPGMLVGFRGALL